MFMSTTAKYRSSCFMCWHAYLPFFDLHAPARANMILIYSGMVFWESIIQRAHCGQGLFPRRAALEFGCLLHRICGMCNSVHSVWPFLHRHRLYFRVYLRLFEYTRHKHPTPNILPVQAPRQNQVIMPHASS